MDYIIYKLHIEKTFILYFLTSKVHVVLRKTIIKYYLKEDFRIGISMKFVAFKN